MLASVEIYLDMQGLITTEKVQNEVHQSPWKTWQVQLSKYHKKIHITKRVEFQPT